MTRLEIAGILSVLMIAVSNAQGQTNTFPSTGNAGVGTTAPIQNPNAPQSGMEIASSNVAVLWLSGTGAQGAAVRGRNINAGNAATAQNDILMAFGGLGFDGASYAGANKASIHFNASQAWTSAHQGTYITFNTTPDNSINRAEVVRISSAGYVGIGTATPQQRLDVTGNAVIHGTVTGDNIQAQYQDIAEWVPAAERISDATVVVIDPDRTNHVLPSSKAYDATVAGVITARPGLILGHGNESEVKVATTGRVKVKVDATRAPIRIGDLLVTSDKPGVAMRSIPVEVSGITMHRPGTLIGKALEPMARGEGEILVLLSLQ
jgi:hypothetical protein